jgi:CRP/FNR family transcriptional regulator, cyclic AMP receptor protein
MTITSDELRRMPLLEGLQERELRRLSSRMHDKTYRPGEVVVAEGTRGVGFSFVVSGTAEVSIDGEPRGRLKAGDHFGELAILDPDHGRQATITATSELTCASITAWEFVPLLREHPDIAVAMLRKLARTLALSEDHRRTHA